MQFMKVHSPSEKSKIKTPGSRLSHRLSMALENALPGKEFWDICCDHGILGIHALHSQNFLAVNFVDQVPHIMNRLEEKIRKYIKKLAMPSSENEKFNFYSCPAELLPVPLKGSVCILGVGAEKIDFILREWLKADLLQADRLILGPHKDTDWFCEKVIPHFLKYHLVKKIDLLEGNKTRTILILDKLL